MVKSPLTQFTLAMRCKSKSREKQRSGIGTMFVEGDAEIPTFMLRGAVGKRNSAERARAGRTDEALRASHHAGVTRAGLAAIRGE